MFFFPISNSTSYLNGKLHFLCSVLAVESTLFITNIYQELRNTKRLNTSQKNIFVDNDEYLRQILIKNTKQLFQDVSCEQNTLLAILWEKDSTMDDFW